MQAVFQLINLCVSKLDASYPLKHRLDPEIVRNCSPDISSMLIAAEAALGTNYNSDLYPASLKVFHEVIEENSKVICGSDENLLAVLRICKKSHVFPASFLNSALAKTDKTARCSHVTRLVVDFLAQTMAWDFCKHAAPARAPILEIKSILKAHSCAVEAAKHFKDSPDFTSVLECSATLFSNMLTVQWPFLTEAFGKSSADVLDCLSIFQGLTRNVHVYAGVMA